MSEPASMDRPDRSAPASGYAAWACPAEHAPEEEEEARTRAELARAFQDSGLLRPRRLLRYDPGQVLPLELRGVHPAQTLRGVFEIEQFAGGGFAGQVYRARLKDLPGQADGPSGLRVGERYALKILVPPSSFARGFRNLLYRIAFFTAIWHYIGYLAFPLQMVRRHPTLARLLAVSYARRLVRLVPVFGESGALLEHLVFDCSYNLPLSLQARLQRPPT